MMQPTTAPAHYDINLVWSEYSRPIIEEIVFASQPQSFMVNLTVCCCLKEQFVHNKGFPSAYKWTS